jgi:voltage-gated sodium channel
MASAAVRVAANLELAKSEKKTDEELLAELMAEGQQGVEPTPWYLDKDNVEGNSCKSKAQRWYIDRALAATEVAENEKFQNFMVAIICIAGLLVGVSTYFDEGQPVIVGIDLLILVCFGFECGVKFLACGMAPWFYVHPSNEEWAWNVFDFSVFFLSLPVFPFKGDSIKLLRLFRLARLIKVIKSFPQLYIIVMGLIGGMKSIVFIMILMALIFYLYAIAGITFFRENDPWHFLNVGRAFVTLFRACTLEDWTDVMYINLFGCDKFYNHFGIYAESDGSLASDCRHPVANPIISPLYWISFVVIAALVVLSLFVGAVTMSMSATMESMKEEIEEAERKATLLKNIENMERMKAAEQLSAGQIEGAETTRGSIAEFAARKKAKALRELALILHEAWADESIDINMTDGDDDEMPGLLGKYQKFSETYVVPIVQHWFFDRFIVSAIIVASVLVGLQTDEGLMCEDARAGTAEDKCPSRDTLEMLDLVMNCIFSVEVVLKVAAEGILPMEYFKNEWNCFDFFLVFTSWLFPALNIEGGFLKVMRLMRLLRILKMIKSIPQLAIIVAALMSGMKSIFYITIITVLFFYMFAILGMILFCGREECNDPWHFSSLHRGILTLWRMSTFEDWTDVMYINMYGCKDYGYDDEAKCDSHASGWIAALYCIAFIFGGALVFLTLFIGAVCSAMDESTKNFKEEKELEENVAEVQEREGLTDASVAQYRKAFALLDLDNGGTIEEDELRMGLEAIGKTPTDEELADMMREVDEDESGEIDFAEFLAFMVNVKKKSDLSGNREPALHQGMTDDEKAEAIAASVRKKLFDNEEGALAEERKAAEPGEHLLLSPAAAQAEKKVVPWQDGRLEARIGQRYDDDDDDDDDGGGGGGGGGVGFSLRSVPGGDGDDSDDDLRDFLVESTRTFQQVEGSPTH